MISWRIRDHSFDHNQGDSSQYCCDELIKDLRALQFEVLKLTQQSIAKENVEAMAIQILQDIELMNMGLRILSITPVKPVGVPENSPEFRRYEESLAEARRQDEERRASHLKTWREGIEWQKDFAVARQTTRSSVRVLLIAIVPICGLIAVRAASVMELVFSESYRGGAGFLSVLVVAHGFCFTASMVFSGILIASGHARQAATLSLALLPLSMIFCAVLVVLKGAEGAALAALSATSLGAFLAGGMVHRWVTPIFFPGVYLRIIAASLLDQPTNYTAFSGPPRGPTRLESHETRGRVLK